MAGEQYAKFIHAGNDAAIDEFAAAFLQLSAFFGQFMQRQHRIVAGMIFNVCARRRTVASTASRGARVSRNGVG